MKDVEQMGVKPVKEKAKVIEPDSLSAAVTFGEYAYSMIETQYRSMVKRERKVLADEDPEHLHQMRVATRRLRTALQVFQAAIALPGVAGQKRIGALARTLGGLRDLDVQIADLKTTYRPQVGDQEKNVLDEVIHSLKKQRRQAYAAVEAALGRSRYQDLKTAYEAWFSQPQLTPLATLPLSTLLPDLLSPLIAELLLHPGWMVAADDNSPHADHTLHDLRKAFKHVRYQTEFFTPFYGDSFQAWVAEIKIIQEKLGKLQDSHVLRELLQTHLPDPTQLPTLQTTIQQTRSEVLSDWDETRWHYLQPEFRFQLYQMLLKPSERTLN
ncbi:MAG: CHAD domain-containing protein [Leptolyngbyaceae cyanobacterium bins.349]|nr:CHAD domain-containing protein [Leptolyngbyaceae cyanobacterium bins.349]